jgi:hypothetical protein
MLTISETHQIWNILSDRLVLGLLDDIQRLQETKTSSFAELEQILLQHPSMSSSLSNLPTIPPIYDPSHSPPPENDSMPGGRATRSKTQGNVRDKKAGAVCCRNGEKVGLARKQGVESVKRREDKIEKRKTNEVLVEEGEEEGIADEREAITKGRKKRRIDDGRDSTIPNRREASHRWMTNGSPPRIHDQTRKVFLRFTTMETETLMVSLASLITDIIGCRRSNDMDMDLKSYNLSFPSLVNRCRLLLSNKATKDFWTALLYIRIAFHIDQ